MNGKRVFNIGMDLGSAAAISAALMQILPPLAALGGVIWYALQIWESKTVQRHVRRRRLALRLKRIEPRQED